MPIDVHFMRMLRFAKHTVRFVQVSSTRTTTGGRSQTTKNLGLKMPCWLQPTTARVREIYASREITVTHSLYIPENPGLTEGDVAKVTVRGVEEKYEVRGFVDMAGVGEAIRIDLES